MRSQKLPQGRVIVSFLFIRFRCWALPVAVLHTLFFPTANNFLLFRGVVSQPCSHSLRSYAVVPTHFLFVENVFSLINSFVVVLCFRHLITVFIAFVFLAVKLFGCRFLVQNYYARVPPFWIPRRCLLFL